MIDLGFLTFSGEPRTMVLPVQVTTTAEMTPDQSAAMEQAYRQFCAAARVSLAVQHLDHFTLPDGTRITCERIGMEDKILVEPAAVAPGQGTVAPIAYPAFVSLEYAPIYDRPILDYGSDNGDREYPPEPVWNPTPYPVAPPSPGAGSTNQMCFWAEYQVVDFFGFISYNLKRIKYTDDSQTYIDLFRKFRSATATPDVYDWVSKGAYLTYKTVEGEFAGSVLIADLAGYTESQIDAAVSDVYGPWKAAASAAADAATAAWIAAYAAWEQAGRDYIAAQYQQYLADHAAWVAACAAIDAQYGPLDGTELLTTLRTAARKDQVTALTAWLDSGVSAPHLAARYLSLPFNVSWEHSGTLNLAGGTNVGNQVTVNTIHREATYTVTNGTRVTTASESYSDGYAQSQMALASGWTMGLDVARPNNLFGWRANGTYKRRSQFFPLNYYERPETAPGDLSTLTFDVAPGYPAYLASPIMRSAKPQLKPTSDAFVPAGVVITLVQLEYETFDPFTRSWNWLPDVGLRKLDAVWLKSMGRYTIPARPGEQSQGVSPRAVRVRRVLRQKRNEDLSWSAPVTVPPDQMREAALPSFTLTQTWQNYPSTVVALLGLPPYAAPKPAPDSTFPFAASAVFVGMDGDFRALATGDWAASPNVITLAAKALHHVYRVI